jgi:hypothetical protein
MRKQKVLFLCTHNSARSQMTEALLRHHAGNRFEEFSAGVDPGEEVHPYAVEGMLEVGIDISDQYPKDPFCGLICTSLVARIPLSGCLSITRPKGGESLLTLDIGQPLMWSMTIANTGIGEYRYGHSHRHRRHYQHYCQQEHYASQGRPTFPLGGRGRQLCHVHNGRTLAISDGYTMNSRRISETVG